MFNEAFSGGLYSDTDNGAFDFDLLNTAILCVYSGLSCVVVFLVEIECGCIVKSFPLLSWWVLRGSFLCFVALQNLHLGHILSTDETIMGFERVASALMFLCGCVYVLLGFCGCSIRERQYAREDVDALKDAEIIASMEAINRKYENVDSDEGNL